MGASQATRNGARGGKKERDSDASPARRLWLAFSRRSSPPLQAEWGNNQMVATTNHLGQLKNPLRFEPKAKAGVTERKRERDGRKSREVSRAASSPAAVQVQASGTRDRDLQK